MTDQNRKNESFSEEIVSFQHLLLLDLVIFDFHDCIFAHIKTTNPENVTLLKLMAAISSLYIF